VKGFDYRVQLDVEKTAAEWRTEIKQVLSDKGHRRVEDGETFLHDVNGKLLVEIYGRIATT
tara:strand:+ start:3159 stop:3341 length:183 start_codon:yes stop_codon:yes gene_type:complete